MHISAGFELFEAREKAVARAKLLRKMVDAWGFEPQTPTVSRRGPDAAYNA
jgi:hypothetical protein